MTTPAADTRQHETGNPPPGLALDLDAVLRDYRRRQRLEHLVGPTVSLLCHGALIILAALAWKPGTRPESSQIEVMIEEMRVRELEPEPVEDLPPLEALADEVVPTVERPELPAEATEISTAAELSEPLISTADALDFSSVLDVRAADTPLTIPGLYGGRSESGRRQLVQKFGGSPRTESAVLKALRWLKETQKADGSWSRTEPDAMAGLGLLTFLAHGETPGSEEFGPTVQKAMHYLAERMMAVDPGKTRYLGRCYTNGIATYALAEAYGLTKIPLLKAPMEKGLGFIVAGQQKIGGYDYNYAKGARWDLSVTGWQIQAMKAGYVAGADVPGLGEAMEKSLGFVLNTAYRNDRFHYSSPTPGSAGMQGAGVLCLQLLGEGHADPARRTIERLHQTEKVVWDNTKAYGAAASPVYAWYYITQAMFHAGRRRWDDWNEAFSRIVVDHQKPDGHWDSPGKTRWQEKHAKTGAWQDMVKPEYDPWYATTMCCLSLQVYYRYLPTYKLPKGIARKEKTVLESLDAELGIELD